MYAKKYAIKMFVHGFFMIFVCNELIVVAVDKSNFKTCSQSSFCREHRFKEFEMYIVLHETIVIERTYVTGTLKNTIANDENLEFQIYSYEDKILRLRIVELSNHRPRYEIPDGDVVLNMKLLRFQVTEGDENHIQLTTPDRLTFIIRYNKFSVETYFNSVPMIQINNQQMLHVEKVQKTKSAKTWMNWISWIWDDDDEEDEEEDTTTSSKPPKDWTEMFHSHKDSRPHGPSSVGIDVDFVGFNHLYGIPEHANVNLKLLPTLRGEPYRLYNLDVFEYELNNNMALYGSVPFLIAHNAKSTVGLYWNNPTETWIDIDYSADKAHTHWISETGVLDIFLLHGPQPKHLFKQYASITGSTPLPPLFAIGYHQSRWNYMDESDVYSIIEGFDDNDIPLDVLWLDIEHTNDKRYFTFDPIRFPHPKQMIDNVTMTTRKMVTAVDPHLKKDAYYKQYSSAQSAGLLVKDRDGNEFEGWCWPGSSAWLDFINPEARKFWSNQFLHHNYEGSTKHLYTWNDMNEPSVFNGPEITMHKDALHHGGLEHREIHNIFGLYVQRSSFEGHLLRSKNQSRPFVLSRSFFAGSQRYGAIWTGDNAADWSHLEATTPMLMTLNLVGMTFSGADVGGFFKNPSVELLVRWYQAATYQPFFRAHAHLDTKRREPYLFNRQYMMLMREAIRERYRLLPYWYLLFYQSEYSGMPIMRPLWVEFPESDDTFEVYNTHMLGDSILIQPVVSAGATGTVVYLPGCQELWYSDVHEAFKGCQFVSVPVTLEKIPVFYRGGSIIPIRERIRRSSSSSSSSHDPYSLLIYLNKELSASGYLYHDDFKSYKYREGWYVYRRVLYHNNNTITSRSLNDREDERKFNTTSWLERIYVVGFERQQVDRITITVHGDDDDDEDLQWTLEKPKKLLIIRKPGVVINKDFEIKIR